jgi:MFS family permease
MDAVQPPATSAARLIPPLLRERQEFRRFWTGQAISLFGDQITLIALPLIAVLALDARASQMGYLAAAGLAPHLLFSLHAGAWVDRRGRRRQAMTAADLGRAGLLGTIPLAWAFNLLTLHQLYAVAFLTGTLSVLFSVSYSTLLVCLTPPGRYVQANSILNGTRAFSFVGGPSVGGLLVQLLSAPLTMVVDAISFVASAFCLGRIAPAEPPTEQRAKGHVVAGIGFIRHSPIVRASLAATATINFFNFALWAILVLYATRELGVPPGTLGLILGAGAVGGVLGSLVTGRIGRRLGIGPTFVLGCVLFPVPLLLVPLAGGPRPLVLAMLFLAELGSGIGVVILDISIGSIFAALIPDHLRSRVSGAYSLVNYGVRPLGSLAGGALGSVLGLRPTLWIATAGAVAGFLWLLPSPVPRLRELPGTVSETPA